MHKLKSSLLFSFLIFNCLAYGQQRLIDSLHTELLKENNVKRKIDLLSGLSRYSIYSLQIKKAEKYIQEIESLSKDINYDKGIILALIYRTNLSNIKHKFNDQLSYSLKAFELSKKQADHDLKLLTATTLADAYMTTRGDINKGLKILLSSLRSSSKKSNKAFLGNIYKLFGYAYENTGEHKKAENSLNKALELYSSFNSNPDVDQDIQKISSILADKCQHDKADVYTFIGYIYLKENKLDQSLIYAKKALALAEDIDALSMVPFQIYDVAECEYGLGKYDSSLNTFLRGLALSRKYGLTNSEGQFLNRLGIYHQYLGDMQSANNYFFKAYNLGRTTNDSLQMIRSLNLIGWTSLRLNKNKEARGSYKTALNIGKIIKDSTNLPNSVHGLAEVKLADKDYLGAVIDFQQAYNLELKLKLEFSAESTLQALAKTYLIAGKIDSAKVYGFKALDLAVKINDRGSIKAIHELLSRIYFGAGEFENAYREHVIFTSWIDSLKYDEYVAKLKAEQVSQNIADYKAEKDRAVQISTLLKTQNRLYIILGIALLLLLLIGTVLFFNLRKTKAKVTSQNLQLEQLNQTKDKFFGIIAHDLRNPISAFQGVGEQLNYYLKKGDTSKLNKISGLISQSAESINRLLDNLLTWALLNRGMIPYKPESFQLLPEVISNIEVHKQSALTKSIDINIGIPDEIDVFADKDALQAILRNLISNAIKFTPKDGKISIEAYQTDQFVNISIEDSGIGISADKLEQILKLGKKSQLGTEGEKGAGLGLILCKELIETNKGVLNIQSIEGEGSNFQFSLPAAKS